jgi:hypothetical protein
MNQLLNGVAIAAVLALAAPAFAQSSSTPMTPSTPPAAGKTMAPAPATTTKTTAAKPMMKKPMHHMAMRKGRMSADDQMTEQLNTQELARLTGGGAPAPAPMSPAPSNYQTPGKSDIPPAPGAMAPPPPAR